jgi:hypothetical protein
MRAQKNNITILPSYYKALKCPSYFNPKSNQKRGVLGKNRLKENDEKTTTKDEIAPHQIFPFIQAYHIHINYCLLAHPYFPFQQI